MPSLNTMIFVALIIVEMIVSVKGADPSALQSKPELEAYTDDTAGGDMGAGPRMPPRKSIATRSSLLKLLTYLRLLHDISDCEYLEDHLK